VSEKVSGKITIIMVVMMMRMILKMTETRMIPRATIMIGSVQADLHLVEGTHGEMIYVMCSGKENEIGSVRANAAGDEEANAAGRLFAYTHTRKAYTTIANTYKTTARLNMPMMKVALRTTEHRKNLRRGTESTERNGHSRGVSSAYVRPDTPADTGCSPHYGEGLRVMVSAFSNCI